MGSGTAGMWLEVGIEVVGDADTLAAMTMAVTDTTMVTGAATLAVATETDMPAGAMVVAATAADMPAAVPMPEMASMAAGTVGAVNLTVADSMVAAVASTVAADMAADAGNPLH